MIDLGKEEAFTVAEVATAIKGIKFGKAAGEDEIRSEMLKALIGKRNSMHNASVSGCVEVCATIENYKISRLLFADDLVLLSSTEPGLHLALHSFADACQSAGMKISTAKTKILYLSINPDQYACQVNGATLKQVEKFKYLGVEFTSDGRQNK